MPRHVFELRTPTDEQTSHPARPQTRTPSLNHNLDQDERNRRMVRDHNAGHSVTQIAQQYGLSLSWTGELLRQHGADMPTSGRGIRCDLDVGEVVRQYESGQTVREVAALQGVSYGKIYRLLADAGVTMRPRGFSAIT